MPPRNTRSTRTAAAPAPVAPPAPAASTSTSTAVALPGLTDDVRADLLRAQQAQITTDQQLPRIKVMPAGAGLFEFGEGGDTARSFEGVVLNSHPRNVLWDKPYGSNALDADGNPEGPACVSSDGRYGSPRPGFPHLGLAENQGHTHDSAPVEASGTEKIECASCPYNQWKSKHLIDPRGGNGKAVTNQKAIYVLLPGQETPSEVIIPPTSIREFDGYIADLLNQNVPVQTVLTTFSQEVKSEGGLRWAVVKFSKARDLNGEEFNLTMAKRGRYLRQITPPSSAPQQATATVSESPADVVDDGGAQNAGDMPNF